MAISTATGYNLNANDMQDDTLRDVFGTPIDDPHCFPLMNSLIDYVTCRWMASSYLNTATDRPIVSFSVTHTIHPVNFVEAQGNTLRGSHQFRHQQIERSL